MSDKQAAFNQVHNIYEPLQFVVTGCIHPDYLLGGLHL